MKKIIAMLACITMLTSCAAAEDVSFALLKQLYIPGGNTVFSPVSLHAALGMAAEGANGVTRDELIALISEASSEELKSANAVFLAPDVALKDAYRAAIDQKYAAESFAIDADIVKNVNAWAEEKTDGMIQNLMQNPPENSGLILINAVAMEKDWEKPFKEENTCEEDFYALSGILPVQMMHQTEHFLYCEKDGAQIICLPYKNSNLEMWIVLPAEGGMEAFLETLDAEGLDYFTDDAGMKEVILSLPKMDVTGENKLVAPLKAMGVNAAFGENADFSGISDTAMFIGDVFQKARISMNEKSTKAAAATMVIMVKGMMRQEEPPVEMRVNRPFFFAVRDSETGAVCFCGAIENPEL